MEIIYEAAKLFGVMAIASILFAAIFASGKGFGWKNIRTWKSAGIISFAFFMFQTFGLLLTIITFQPIQ